MPAPLPVPSARTTTSPSRWIVAQIGAREHYAIPRALIGAGQAVRLLTDYWARGSSWMPVPGRLRERRHAAVPDEDVTDFGSRLLQFEAVSRLKGLQGWPRIEARNAWFDRLAANRLAAPGTGEETLFTYSYAARRTLEAARRRGLRTLLGQIDPGPVEWRVVQDRRARAGLPLEPEPSADYWANWREECRLADGIVVNSDWSRRALLEEGVPDDRIHVVPLAYERSPEPPGAEAPPAPTEEFTADRPLQVLFLGQVLVRKGILEICEAMERLAGRPVVWTFVGSGEPELLARLAAFPEARVVGGVRRQEAGLHYRAADIFLLPTHSDGFAITQLEAAAYGLPIIASRCCGDVVRQEVDGLLLDRVTGEAIADAVASILSRPQRLARFREAQRLRPPRTLAGLAADLIAIRHRTADHARETSIDV